MRRSAILLLALAIVLSAQDFRATLNGTVLDPSGAVVPKAQLEVRNTETGEVRKAVTQPNGQFSVPLLPPGTYTASAEAPGFKKVLRENIVLRAGQAFGIEMTLQVGTVTEQVVVHADTPVLETEKPDRGTVIDTARINRELIAKAEAVDSPQRVVLDMDRTEIPVTPGRKTGRTTGGLREVGNRHSAARNNAVPA